MEKKERLFLGLGIMAYAVARADGHIDQEEREKLHELVKAETDRNNFDYDLAEITFKVLEKYDGYESSQLPGLAMKEIEIGKEFLQDDMRTDFCAILEKVARAFHPITKEENKLILDFKQRLNEL